MLGLSIFRRRALLEEAYQNLWYWATLICSLSMTSFVRVFVVFALASIPYTAQTEVPELDVTKIGLRPRAEVIKIIGQPDKSGPLGSDYYRWGLTGYENGKLDEIDYKFKTAAKSVEGAVQKVGLRKTSAPTHGPLTYFWNSSTGPLVCCGFEMDNVVISLDFSGIMVGFKRKIASGAK